MDSSTAYWDRIADLIRYAPVEMSDDHAWILVYALQHRLGNDRIGPTQFVGGGDTDFGAQLRRCLENWSIRTGK